MRWMDRCRGLALALSVCVASGTAAGPVTLDTAFGTGGKALSNFRGNTDTPVSPLRDAAGRWLFFSIGENGGAASQLNVVRLLADGTLDPAFGDGGIASLFPVNTFMYAGGMTLDGDGRILLAYAVEGDGFCNSVGVTRLTADGELDSGFGSGGSVFLDPADIEFPGCGSNASSGIGWNGSSGSDYRLALATTSTNAAGTQLHGTITQLLENGTPDTAFHANGVRQLALGASSTFRGLAFSGNRIYAWGSRTLASTGGMDPPDTDVLIARFQSFNGELDALFGSVMGAFGPGYVTTEFGSGDSVANALRETDCPEFGGVCFYIAGSVTDGTAKQALLARYIATSQCDTRSGTRPCLHTGQAAFDTDGWLTLDLDGSGSDDEAWAVTVKDDSGAPADWPVGIVGIDSLPADFGVGEVFAARWTASGVPDTGFDGDGVKRDVFSGDAGPRSYAAEAADGSLFVLGRGIDGFGRDSVAARLQNSGVLLPSFGSGGLVRIKATGAFVAAQDLAVDATGRALMIGYVRDAAEARFEIGVARFTAAGARDASFDGDGGASYGEAGDTFGEGYGIAAQTDGKIVAVGATGDGVDTRLTVLRLASNGALDAGFAAGGGFRLAGVGSSSVARDVLVESGGRIVATGYVATGANLDLALVALDSDGDLDTAFGTGNTGYSVISLPGNEVGVEVRRLAAGGYVVVGTNGTDVVLARFDANGLPLSTTVDAALPVDVQARALALDAAGNAYVGGQYLDSGLPMLARFNAMDALDTGWGSNGQAVFGAADLPGWIDSIDLDAGKPLASGSASNGAAVEHVAYRLLADGSGPDTDFDDDGRVTVAHPPGAFGNGQALLPDGSLLLSGTGSAQMAIAKLATRSASSVTLGALPAAASQYAQDIQFSATASGGAGTPTGTVELYSGATLIDSATLDGAGVAAMTVDDLEVGGYGFTARYLGDGVYAPSVSTPALAYTVDLSDTTATIDNLDADENTANGENVSFTFTASGVWGTVPTGAVRLFVDNVAMGDYSLFAGTTTITTDDLTPGAHSLHVVYLGDQRHAQSPPSTPVPHSVGKAASGTSLQVAPTPSAVGQNVTMTAQVGGQSGLPVTGSVEFRDGANVLDTVALDVNQIATYSTTALAAGDHSLSARYVGDSNYLTSTSSTVMHNVGKLAATTLLNVAPSPSDLGESVTLSASVSGGATVPTGSIQFRDGANVLQTVALVNGEASMSTAALALGLHTLTAVYSGDAEYAANTSDPFSHSVEKLSTQVTLMAAPNPSQRGQQIALTATVASQPGFPATGSVEFREGALLLATVALANGEADFAISTLGAGTHALRAVYLGDANYNAATSTQLDQVVQKLASTTALGVAPAGQSQFGQNVVLTATVNGNLAFVPGGNVEFRDGATVLATVTLSNGIATHASTAFAAGGHTFAAVYLGDTNYTGSNSNGAGHVVVIGDFIFADGFE